MEKRLILAIALSLLVLLSWSALAPKPQQIDNKEVTTKITPPSAAQLPPIVSPSLAKPSAPSLMKVEREQYEIIFNQAQATIQEVIFKKYQSAKLILQQGFSSGDPNWVFSKGVSEQDTTTFIYRDKEKSIVKRFRYSNSNYDIWLEIEVQNTANAAINLRLPVVLGVLNFSGDPTEARFQDVTAVNAGQALHLNPRKNTVVENIQILGLRNRYFCAILEPLATAGYAVQIQKLNPQESAVSLLSPEYQIAPSQKIEQKFHIYLGPQDLQLINRLNSNWSAVVHYGAFTFIAQLLLQFLGFLYSLVHNWGVAIVILSLAIYFLFFPLTLKQMRSMKEMQALQPAIEALRQTYKDNPQKLNKEIMELYRQHKVNPFGGCLPLILQIPVFFALYQALIRFVALKGAGFLWIKDLSQPDRLFTFSASLPIIGNEINILPLLMAMMMFFQQKSSMGATSGSSAEQQKLMLIVFPVMFGLIFYRMSSGLVLYWFMNTLLMLLYQVRIKRASK